MSQARLQQHGEWSEVQTRRRSPIIELGGDLHGRCRAQNITSLYRDAGSDAGCLGLHTGRVKAEEAEPVEVQFKCPCGEALSAYEKDVNRTIACHQCGRILAVPAVPVAAGIGARYEHGAVQETEEAVEAVEAGAPSWRPSLPPAAERPTTVSGLAVASLVLGVVGPFLGMLTIIAGILAIVFGGVALKSIASSPWVQGRGMAIAGIMLGAVDVLLGVALVFATYGGQQPEDSLDVICNLVSPFF